MIIVKIGAGLGNQLFQYAYGRTLSVRNNDILKLDITSFKTFEAHPYVLKHFNVIHNIATKEEIKNIHYPLGIVSRLIKKLQYHAYFKYRKSVRSSQVGFKKSLLNKKGNLYLVGYWQSEKYFMEIENIIREEFTLNKPLCNKSCGVLDEISKCDKSISIHIRKGVGKYVISSNHPFWGINTVEYCSNAIKYIAKILGKDLHVFVFSDDILAAKKDLSSLKYPITFVSSPEIPDYEEMILMSKCKHNVIANSTFSWWAAWLNQNPNKIVVAPKTWARKDDDIFKDIVPTSWIRL